MTRRVGSALPCYCGHAREEHTRADGACDASVLGAPRPGDGRRPPDAICPCDEYWTLDRPELDGPELDGAAS